VHHAALPARIGVELGSALDQAHAGIGHNQLDALQATLLEVAEEGAPTGLVLLGALDDAQDLPVALVIDRDRYQQRHVAGLASSGAFEHDPVEIKIGMLALDWRVDCPIEGDDPICFDYNTAFDSRAQACKEERIK
jgi:hypothetical protein